MTFSDLAKAYDKQATDMMKNAIAARDAYYVNAGANASPAVDVISPFIGAYQPYR